MCRPAAVCRTLLTAFVGAVVAILGLTTPAYANVLWASEQGMLGPNQYRSTYIYDNGGGLITYEQFASPGVAAFYQGQGFDRNFMYWAPIELINRPNEYWKACSDNDGGLCPASRVRDGLQLISAEIGSGQIHVKRWGTAFIGAACGNWNHTGPGPIPRLTGVKFEDVNGNSARDAGEPGLANWTIDLYYNGAFVTSRTTGPDGSYEFQLNANGSWIGAGTYTVAERQQPGWVQSRTPAPVSVGYGAADRIFGGNDFGNYRPAAINGRKFEDMNADGAGTGDPGVPGWTISSAGPSAGSTVTGPDGGYHLAGLAPGTYTIGEQSQAGWNQSLPGGSGNHTVTVRSGDNISGIDFGNWRPATIEGRKFDDSNVDGTSANGSGGTDAGLPDWAIDLADGSTTTTSNTSSGGGYRFSGLRPGTYTVQEQQQAGWRQTAPAGGSTTITVTSGQVVSGIDIGNVCLGNIAVTAPAGVAVRVDEITVPGILANEPAMPRLASGTSTISGLLPGTYRVTLTLPDGIFTTDPDLTSIDGVFAIVKTITITECNTTAVAPVFVTSAPGKITGGVRTLVPGGFATAGFEFMQRNDGPRGTLEFNDHASGVRVHTSDITGISASGGDAYIFGRAVVDNVTYVFRLHLIDAGEPGTADRFELLIANGYSAGTGQTLDGGNIQIH